MNDYKQQTQIYVQSKKEEFSNLNDYNSKVVSFGFAAFFAIATYVKTYCMGKFFVLAILFMTISVILFVVFELYRSYLLNRNARDVSMALDKLPDEHPLLLVDSNQVINYVRLQRLHPYFFFPSLIFGLIAVALLFICYLKVLFL